MRSNLINPQPPHLLVPLEIWPRNGRKVVQHLNRWREIEIKPVKLLVQVKAGEIGEVPVSVSPA